MTKKNLFKKIASVALAGALTLSMALPVGAATEDPESGSRIRTLSILHRLRLEKALHWIDACKRTLSENWI